MDYTIVRGDTLSRIAEKLQVTLSQLLAANPQYKPNPNKVQVGQKVRIPAASPSIDKRTVGKKTAAGSRQNLLTVEAGQLTFDAEGSDNENSRYFSLRPHVPSASSGLTVGRGYDMKFRSEQEVIDDLRECGVGVARAKKLATGAGLVGDRAKDHLHRNKLKEEKVSRRQQKDLFNKVYAEMEADVLRICNKADVVAKYGKTAWDRLDPRLRDLVVDLRYRGDYHPRSRERVQPVLVSGDVDAMAELMADKTYWDQFDVPTDRFRRRKAYLAKVNIA